MTAARALVLGVELALAFGLGVACVWRAAQRFEPVAGESVA